jgi:hypothetical protein
VVRGGRSPYLIDALALLVFVTIGVLTHGSSFLDWLRDLALFEAAWFALYRLPLVARWAVGITAAVAVRAAIVGHFSVAFWLVALAFTALLLACFRVGWRRFS